MKKFTLLSLVFAPAVFAQNLPEKADGGGHSSATNKTTEEPAPAEERIDPKLYEKMLLSDLPSPAIRTLDKANVTLKVKTKTDLLIDGSSTTSLTFKNGKVYSELPIGEGSGDRCGLSLVKGQRKCTPFTKLSPVTAKIEECREEIVRFGDTITIPKNAELNYSTVDFKSSRSGGSFKNVTFKNDEMNVELVLWCHFSEDVKGKTLADLQKILGENIQLDLVKIPEEK